MAESDRVVVTLAMDFSDEILAELREISPRLQVERHFPTVSADVIAKSEVLYTTGYYPEPEQAPKLRWIQMNSAGVNHALHHHIVQAEDIVVTTISGIHASNMAQYCLMAMLMFNYQMRQPPLNCRAGRNGRRIRIACLRQWIWTCRRSASSATAVSDGN